MKKLSYETLKEQNYQGYLLKDAPERVLQFGEGNFLRAFVDYFIDMMNEKAGFNSKVVLVQPIGHAGGFNVADVINEQEGLYTLYLRGFENGQKVNAKRIISCVSRCLNVYSDYETVMACAENPDLRYIACNTTEAGIAYDPQCRLTETPPSTYPAKLTQFLYRRFQKFGKEAGKGFVILACELIDDNGKELETCVLKYAEQWHLEPEFIQWLKDENIFCSTLVDRIVTGFPRGEAAEINEENGYEDNILDTGEVFGFWVIEGPESLKKELPFAEAGLPVLITDNHKPYKQRKVRILNGAHT
ncbi:MAG TPA: tagaturonate reductase, partial [Lachnospiraceae bacterium]|nr:tagaturonate reductase [Lachnospiraceae bacterium]